jgi:hypothetical protein
MQGTGIAHTADTGNVEFHTQDHGIMFITGMFLQLSIESQVIIIKNIRFMTEIDTIGNTGTDGKKLNIRNIFTDVKDPIIFVKSLLSSLCQREDFSFFGKERQGENTAIAFK